MTVTPDLCCRITGEGRAAGMRVQINLSEQEEECAEMASGALLTHVRAVRRQATCHAAATAGEREGEEGEGRENSLCFWKHPTL